MHHFWWVIQHIILNSGSNDYLQGVKEEYEQYKTDSVESSFDENSEELRIREGNDNWDNVIFENRGTNKENGTLPITSGKNSNGAGNTEGIVSNSQIDSEYIELAKDPAKNKARLRELVDQAAKENSYSRPMFHGSRKSADIKVFKDWQYFTENKAYAERYADAKLYEVFVKLGQFFDTREESARELFYEVERCTLVSHAPFLVGHST